MIKRLLILLILFTSNILAEEVGVDCLIIKDENSIICKYTQERALEDRNIKVTWIDPNNNISRERDMILPSGHGSIYDFRYIQGRMLGIWIFKIVDNDIEYKTTFELK